MQRGKMRPYSVLLFSVFAINLHIILIQAQRSKSDEQVSSIVNAMLKGYDKRVRPNSGGPPIDVGISMFILRIDSICSAKMETTITYNLRQSWFDPRLNYTGQPPIFLVIGNALKGQIWIPDTFFVNKKTDTFSAEMLRVTPKGDVLHCVRMTTTVSCPMDLQLYPMDRQTCSLEMESFSSSMTDIRYYWSKGTDSVGIQPNASLAEWKIMGHREQGLEISLSTGNYSRLNLHVQFARTVGSHISSAFLPSIILVTISWMTFWFNGEAMIARVLTGVLSTISLVRLWQRSTSNLAKVSYVKAIDVYFGGCVALVIITILEHAMITCLVKRRKNYRRRLDSEIPRNNSLRKPCCLRLAPRLLDWFCRLAFPITFIVFNIVYWKLYLTISDVKEQDLIPFNQLQGGYQY